MKNRFPALIAHACIVLVLVAVTLLIVDSISPSMQFWNNTGAKVLIGALCLASTAGAATLLARR